MARYNHHGPRLGGVPAVCQPTFTWLWIIEQVENLLFSRARASAAKGVLLLGVRAATAESFERIHRTNLVGMGVAAAKATRGLRPKQFVINYMRPDL